MKYLSIALLAIAVSGCSAVGYHGGTVTVTDGYALEKKITALDGRDIELTIWAHANSDGVREQTLRQEARAYGASQGCPTPAIERLVFGLSNAMLDARRYARATVRCLPQARPATAYQPGQVYLNAPLPEPVIEPSPSNVRNQNNSRANRR